MLKISAFSLVLTRENTDFSTHLMKYIGIHLKKVNIPTILYGLQKNVFMFMAYRCTCRYISLYDILKGTSLLGPP